MRATSRVRRVLLALLVLLVPVASAACTDADIAAFVANYHPAPQGRDCVGTSVQPAIDDAFFGADVAKASRTAYRESRCNDGEDTNPVPCDHAGDHAMGLFQLCAQWGYIEAACPGYPGGALVAVNVPWCNAHAARLIFNARGWAPWGGGA